jgi:acyl-CoA synthetase (NDP forming)
MRIRERLRAVGASTGSAGVWPVRECGRLGVASAGVASAGVASAGARRRVQTEVRSSIARSYGRACLRRRSGRPGRDPPRGALESSVYKNRAHR